MAARRVLLCAPRRHLRDLEALTCAWRDAGAHVDAQPYTDKMPDLTERVAGRADLDAALLVGPARRAPATVFAAPFAVDRNGRRVPIAWLPAVGAAPLRRFAETAARVHRRKGSAAAVALLGQWHPRYLRIVERMEALLGPHLRTFRWSSDLISREGLVAAMGSGLGLGVYVGHGRPVGWVGYHGLRGQHFEGFAGEPMGAVLSLCCRTASRRRTGLSYAERLPLLGVAASSFGATCDTLHADNTRWAITLCDALAQGMTTVGELVVRAAPASPSAVACYRLLGDPLAPLTSSPAALLRAGVVQLYP